MEIKLIPNITEKTSGNIVKDNTYSFVVLNKDVNATILKKHLSAKYEVTVKRVNISNRLGKIKSIGKKRTTYRRPTVKIAYVTLAEGQSFPEFNLENNTK